jgi:nucleoside-diphosphate-sugar epimerase
MKFNTGQSILPASLVRDLAIAKKTEIPFRVSFDNRVRREYSYSFDLARAILWCLESQESNTLLNIGNTVATSIPELTRLIAKALQYPDELISLEDVPVATRLVQSTSNAEFLKLSNFKYTPLEEAIQKAVEWYLESA